MATGHHVNIAVLIVELILDLKVLQWLHCAGDRPEFALNLDFLLLSFQAISVEWLLFFVVCANLGQQSADPPLIS